MFTHRTSILLTLILVVAAEEKSWAVQYVGFEDSLRVYQIDEIVIERTRADRLSSPVAFTDLSQEEIDRISIGQDVPMVLATMPSTYAYSDAANGFGYTYLKIRGFDQNRLSIMMNGVPLNDPESHQVYWVDHADVLSGASSVQVQRGVGTTLFGATSFGGSVNVLTSPLAVDRGLHLEAGYGDYTDRGLDAPVRTYRASVATGPIRDGTVALYGRYSRQDSEGYREASGADLESFSLAGLYGGPYGNHKLDLLVGNERTHFAWDGVSPEFGVDLDDREERRFNYYSIYKNNVDDFRQVILSLTSALSIHDRYSITNTAYYVDGDGFFEQFKEGRDLYDYGFPESDSLFADLVQKRWLTNSYWGLLPQVSTALGDGKVTVGVGLRRYRSEHYGEILWSDMDLPFDPSGNYYSYESTKTSFEGYAQLQLVLADRTVLSTGLQYQAHRYDWMQEPIGNFRGYEFEVDHDFISPRFGIKHTLNPSLQAYGSISYAQREPSDSDYIDGDDPSSAPAFEGVDLSNTGLSEPIVKPESLLDLEWGFSLDRSLWATRVGFYRLDFRDELVPIDGGRIEEEGRLRRANADQTVHSGIELEGTVRPVGGLSISGNLSLARHRFVDHEIFAYWLNDYEGGLLKYDGNTIPRSPEILGNLSTSLSEEPFHFRGELQYTGKQYIDGENTEPSAIDAFTLVNLSVEIDLGERLKLPRPLTVTARVDNLYNTLYETWGYNYYDDYPPTSFNFYWPGPTRSFFLSLETVL